MMENMLRLLVGHCAFWECRLVAACAHVAPQHAQPEGAAHTRTRGHAVRDARLLPRAWDGGCWVEAVRVAL